MDMKVFMSWTFFLFIVIIDKGLLDVGMTMVCFS